MIAHEIPLNQVDLFDFYIEKNNFCFVKGCMRPIEVILPSGSLLDPHKDVAVVGKSK
jgi:N-methylhydantoinase B/oxoprolinase/acetone carboxylase alpha subunit